MKKEITNYGRSVRSRLLNVARNEGERFQQVVTRYLQERLLYRLSQSRYQCNFVLKGGALLYAYQGLAARPTLELGNVRRVLNKVANCRIGSYHIAKKLNTDI